METNLDHLAENPHILDATEQDFNEIISFCLDFTSELSQSHKQLYDIVQKEVDADHRHCIP
jgi:hypothetical protein